MSKLPLAIDIADAAAEADASEVAIDLDQKSSELQAAHPEAESSRDDIEKALGATAEKSTLRQKRKP